MHQPPPILNEFGTELFEFGQIIDRELKRGVPHYLVSWQGYDSSYNEWLPFDVSDKASMLSWKDGWKLLRAFDSSIGSRPAY